MVVDSPIDAVYNELLNMVKELSDATIRMYEKTLETLNSLDTQRALCIIKSDTEIDTMEEELIEFATIQIVRQQPVATDLRKILMIIRLAREYERIADYTENIAEYIILIKENESLDHYEKNVDKFSKMIEIIIEMLNLVIEGLLEENKAKIKEAADMDNRVDTFYHEVMESLIQHIRIVDGKVFGTAHAILINKYLERAGDHVTNIAEEMLYALKGRRYNLG
ncbi:MAG: phosphate signaling complex protein PhoU [Defluviitaleaceae bacterium]|nr:phosphate signaling complex protein PhoU [Defluviitaleaceae bacterium]